MKKTALLSLLLLVGPAAASMAQERQMSGLQSTLVSIEEKLWEAWKNRDGKPFEMHLAADCIEIGGTGIRSQAQIVERISGGACDVQGYSLSEWNLHRISDDTAILTYKASQVDATCDGNKVPAQVYANTVFVKRGEKWLAAAHQETPSTSTSQ